MSSDIAIKVENLSKCYQIYEKPQDRLKQSIYSRVRKFFGRLPINYFREFWALKEISFEVKRGETVGIIGRNGSGKSTLLQLICGTLNPTSGNIQVNGRVAALLELGSGFNPEFTGRENVYMNASVLGLSNSEINERFEEIATFADIGDFIDQPVKTYSSGMVVRLAFAVIAHVNADILVIDEALAVGDAFFTQKCMRFLRDFMKKGTILFVSHDTSAVISICDIAIWLSNGESKKQGIPKDIAQSYLADQYESMQGDSAIKEPKQDSDPRDKIPNGQLRDMRQDYINASAHRNDLQLYEFDVAASSFGKGGGRIFAVTLFDWESRPLSWIVGGEFVRLKIKCEANKEIFSPIVGFYLKDKLGQYLFGDNTCKFSQHTPELVRQGGVIEAIFEFRMPILPIGDYSITVAFAEGTQNDHIQHDWIHDALIIKSHSSSVCNGLIGIPMNKIALGIYE